MNLGKYLVDLLEVKESQSQSQERSFSMELRPWRLLFLVERRGFLMVEANDHHQIQSMQYSKSSAPSFPCQIEPNQRSAAGVNPFPP